MILEIEAIFPGGRFHGEEWEWPPAPSRLFQALIAATHRGAHGLINQPKRDAALRWLETLPAPSIAAGEATPGCAHLDNYVPNNDGKSAHVRTAKTLAVHAFSPGNKVAFRWTFDGSGAEAAGHADAVAAMASLVTYLGQTTDSVFARGRVFSEAELPSNPQMDGGRAIYQPREAPGGRWLAPAPGFFALCVRRYPRSVSSEPPDFSNSRQVDYAPPGAARHADPTAAPMEIFEMVDLEGENLLRFCSQDVRQPAGMARWALLEWGKKEYVRRAFEADLLARLLAGHRGAADFAPSDRNGHFGVVPLPSLNREAKADGDFRRVALIGWGATAEDRARELFDEAARGLHGAELRDEQPPARGGGASSSSADEKDEENGAATRARQRRGMLRLSVGPSAERWRTFWTEPSCCWRSVTPIVLPGLLRAGRTAETLIARALTQAGFAAENIASVAAFRGPLVPHTLPARQYRIQGYLNQAPRCHAEIIFKNPVQGPLVLGRGRYAGLGLCVPFRG